MSDKHHIFWHRSWRPSLDLANSISGRQPLLSCWYQNALQEDHRGDNFLPQSRWVLGRMGGFGTRTLPWRLFSLSKGPQLLTSLPFCNCSTAQGVVVLYLRCWYNNVTSGKFPKRKSCDNNHLKPHSGQFDLLCDASPSRALIWSRGTLSPYAFVSLRTHLLTHLSTYALVFLRTHLTITSVYQPEKHSTEIFIWDCLFVGACNLTSSIVAIRDEEFERSVRCNQHFSLV